MSESQAPVLIVGGSGVVGSLAVQALRRLQPRLPIVIGGRDLAKAQRVASDIAGVSAIEVDVASSDLRLRPEQPIAAMAVFLKDERLNSMRVAQDRGIPYVSLSSGAFEMGPEIAQYIHAPERSPIVVASHWLAGASLFAALHHAHEFRSVESIRIGVLLDPADMGGPAAYADYERITGTAPSAMAVRDGQFVWRRPDESNITYVSVDGRRLEAQPYSPFDIMSLAVATGARDVSLNLAYSHSASTVRGEPLSTEIVIDMDGVLQDGRRASRHVEIVHPAGQAPLTGLCVALLLERLVGATGAAAPAPGLYFPELLLDAADVVRKMEDFGTRIESQLRIAAS